MQVSKHQREDWEIQPEEGRASILSNFPLSLMHLVQPLTSIYRTTFYQPKQ